MMLGVTGVGKSTLCNFISGKANAFPESEIIMESMTKSAAMETTMFGDRQNQQLTIIDTPGLGDTAVLGKTGSKAKDIAADSAGLVTELTKMMLIIRGGVSAFLIVIPAHVREHFGTLILLDFLSILGDYQKHSIVVLTHGRALGRTHEEQYDKFQRVLNGEDCPPIWKTLDKMVNGRFVIVESKEWRMDKPYRKKVVNKLLSLTSEITKQHGKYNDVLNSIGIDAYDKAKMQVLRRFGTLESPEAEEAIFTSVYEQIEKVIYKLVKIKLADGEDVDKIKEMAEMKRQEAEHLQEEASLLREEYLEEQRRRKEAEVQKERAVQETEEERRKREKAEIEKQEERNKRETAESEKRKAVQETQAERRQREQAEIKKQKAEQNAEVERSRRERAEIDKQRAVQETQAERIRREQVERHNSRIENEKYKIESEKIALEHQKQHEQELRRRTEREKEQIALEKEEERHKRQIAEQEKYVAEQLKREKDNMFREAEREKQVAWNESQKECVKREFAEHQKIEAEKKMQGEIRRREELEEEIKRLMGRSWWKRLLNVKK